MRVPPVARDAPHSSAPVDGAAVRVPVSHPWDQREREAHDAENRLMGTITGPDALAPGPLDASTRALFERRLGHDLGAVRIHRTEEATARALGAQAFTVGTDVFLPGRQGVAVLAHELTHAAQHVRDAPGAPTQVMRRPLEAEDADNAPIGDRFPGEAALAGYEREVTWPSSPGETGAVIWREGGTIVGILEIDGADALRDFTAGKVTAESLIASRRALWSAFALTISTPAAESDTAADSNRSPGGTSTTSAEPGLGTVIADVSTDFIPGVSNVKDALIALTGINPVTGEKVTWPWRIASAIFAIPGFGNLAKYGVKGTKLIVKGLKALGPAVVRGLKALGRGLKAAGSAAVRGAKWVGGKASSLGRWVGRKIFGGRSLADMIRDRLRKDIDELERTPVPARAPDPAKPDADDLGIDDALGGGKDPAAPLPPSEKPPAAGAEVDSPEVDAPQAPQGPKAEAAGPDGEGGLRFDMTANQESGIRKLAQSGGDWTALTAKERRVVGTFLHRVMEGLVARLAHGGWKVVRRAKVTPAEVAKWRAAGDRVLLVEARLPKGGRMPRLDVAEIDIKNGKITVLDYVPTSDPAHRAKTAAYGAELARKTGLPATAVDVEYVKAGHLVDDLPLP